MEGRRRHHAGHRGRSLTSTSAKDRGCVVLFGAKGDPQIRRVTREVRECGGRVFLIDSIAFPERARVSFDDGRILVNGRTLPDSIRSAYIRSLGTSYQVPELAKELEARPHGLLAQLDECGALMVSVACALRTQGVPLVNDLEVNAQHGRKPYQLKLLCNAGLPVPRFLASNDPKAVRQFVRRAKRAVYKPLAGGATVREVERDDLSDDRLEALQYAPVLFQELIVGTSVRAYVIGEKIAAAGEIHSSELDYRRQEGAVNTTRLTVHERRAAIAAAHACSMRFAGVDLIRAKDGFVVLECNPSPMFAVFEDKTGQDVAGALAQYLFAPRK